MQLERDNETVTQSPFLILDSALREPLLLLSVIAVFIAMVFYYRFCQLASDYIWEIVNNRNEMEFAPVILYERSGVLVKNGFSLICS